VSPSLGRAQVVDNSVREDIKPSDMTTRFPQNEVSGDTGMLEDLDSYGGGVDAIEFAKIGWNEAHAMRAWSADRCPDREKVLCAPSAGLRWH
jgi:hypothetical protein